MTNRIKITMTQMKNATKKNIKLRTDCVAGSEIKNHLYIKNIEWRVKSGVSARPDDVITFDYRGQRYRLESRYTGLYSLKQEHS
jgi:hypothetical protein